MTQTIPSHLEPHTTLLNASTQGIQPGSKRRPCSHALQCATKHFMNDFGTIDQFHPRTTGPQFQLETHKAHPKHLSISAHNYRARNSAISRRPVTHATTNFGATLTQHTLPSSSKETNIFGETQGSEPPLEPIHHNQTEQQASKHTFPPSPHSVPQGRNNARRQLRHTQNESSNYDRRHKHSGDDEKLYTKTARQRAQPLQPSGASNATTGPPLCPAFGKQPSTHRGKNYTDSKSAHPERGRTQSTDKVPHTAINYPPTSSSSKHRNHQDSTIAADENKCQHKNKISIRLHGKN